MRTALIFILLFTQALIVCPAEADSTSSNLHAFYYPWYSTPEFSGEFLHWRHDVMGDESAKTYPGGNEIGANFYPEGGCYSSADPEVIRRHMRQLRQAGIGVICVSWFGPDCFEGRCLEELFEIAGEHGIMINFHLEPAVQSSIHTIREAIVNLIDLYGDHPAFYHAAVTGGRGLFYVYDSYNTPASEWARLLTPGGDITIRGTRWDAAIVGLLVNESDKSFIEDYGFDGAYAYFAVDGFSYASTSDNWSSLVDWSEDKDLLFIPSVGPGYSDLRIRPWNQRNQRLREEGRYYDCMFAKAIQASPPIIGITSFNEWHEGTQIEPAMPFSTGSFTYLDYQPLHPDAYLQRTAEWAGKWLLYKEGVWSPDSAHIGSCGGGPSRSLVTHLAVGRHLHLATSFSETYTGGGQGALIDGVTGSNSYRDGCWQGYEGLDLIATIDLGEPQSVAHIQLGFLRDHSAWIFLPRRIRVEGSLDGEVYTQLATLAPRVPGDIGDPLRYEMVANPEGQRLRFIRVTAEAEKICPDNHPGAGQPAWLFVDELQVRSASFLR